MNRFTQLTGTLTPLYRPNIDTDQIIPKQFLKRIERSGYGEFLFYDWRYKSDGTPISGFILNDLRYGNSSILVAGPNFGCGSSREHAPWSLMDYGFRAVIAPSFADIFYNNSLKNGLVPVVLAESDVAEMAARAEADPENSVTVDLENQSVSAADSFERSFEIDPFRKYCILNGLDEIGLTLEHAGKIADYERNSAAETRFSFIQS